jgi:spore maturation protein CgeB
MGLEFFGDPHGWRTVFGGRAPVHPDVNYFSETPCVYRSATVSINATSLQMPQAVNQRVFDVPACGGFLLTDRQHDLDELFEPGEVAVYDGADDIADRTSFWLSHGVERRQLAEQARRRVMAHHTYGRRMQQLLDVLVR